MCVCVAEADVFGRQRRDISGIDKSVESFVVLQMGDWVGGEEREEGKEFYLEKYIVKIWAFAPQTRSYI